MIRLLINTVIKIYYACEKTANSTGHLRKKLYHLLQSSSEYETEEIILSFYDDRLQYSLKAKKIKRSHKLLLI